MALDRKDFRGKLSAEAHKQLVALAELHDKDISDYGSYLLERALLGEAHVAKLYAERVARWGKSGISGENPGIEPGSKTRLRGV